MILGVNGIRLIGKRSGVGQCIEAILRCMGELDHPFDEIRVYTPVLLSRDVFLPPRALNVVLRSPSRLVFGSSSRCPELLVRFPGLSPERIHVVPDGVDTRRFRPCADSGRVAKWRIEAFVSDVPFILYVEKTR